MDIKSMTLDELKDACQQMGEKPFRAKQLYDWMHHRLAGSYDEMTNLSLAFREKLKEQYPLTCLEKVRTGIPDHLPNGSSINKQITYGEYLEKYKGAQTDILLSGLSGNNSFTKR